MSQSQPAMGTFYPDDLTTKSSNGKVYGHIPEYNFGHHFGSRAELSRAGVHAPTQAGIHGDPDEGAFSICISGGYEDDSDRGEKITYVGSGGRDADGNQVAHQKEDDGPNKSLKASSQKKRPVRVIRGPDKSCHWAPAQGYRYDGLYVVDSFKKEAGKAGYQMCFFELRMIKETPDQHIPYKSITMKELVKIGRQAPKS